MGLIVIRGGEANIFEIEKSLKNIISRWSGFSEYSGGEKWNYCINDQRLKFEDWGTYVVKKAEYIMEIIW